jgi:Rap1a immunity proteins
MRLGRISLVTIIIVSAVTQSSTKAQTVKLGSYLNEQRKEFVMFDKIYLAGVFDGLDSYNIDSKQKRFCIPPKLALQQEQLDDMVRRWATQAEPPLSAAALEAMTTADALLIALEQTFPCQ